MVYTGIYTMVGMVGSLPFPPMYTLLPATRYPLPASHTQFNTLFSGLWAQGRLFLTSGLNVKRRLRTLREVFRHIYQLLISLIGDLPGFQASFHSLFPFHCWLFLLEEASLAPVNL